MADSHTFICRCSAEFKGMASSPPQGWSRIGEELICDDCTSALHFTFGNASEAPPTPIRASGKDSATAILLRSGVYLDLADPDCTRIAPADIAAGLRQLRFAGQSAKPYTIAQHSLLVLRLVDPVANQLRNQAAAQSLRRCALLHDAAEAFIHDITRPLKSQLPDYRAYERAFEDRLFSEFGVEWTKVRKGIVKRADIAALAIEKRELLDCHDPWPILERLTGNERWAALNTPLGRIWSLDEAEARFLDAFNALFPQHERIAA